MGNERFSFDSARVSPYHPAPMSKTHSPQLLPHTLLPHYVDPGKMAEQSAQLVLRTPLAAFKRLREVTLGDAGEVSVQLKFHRDARGVPNVRGVITATVEQTCQRCMSAVTVPLQADVNVFLLNDEVYADRLSEDDDYVVFEDDRLDLLELIEDELIMSLPLVARHEDCQPQAALTVLPEADDEPMPKKENPFRVLAGLKPSDTE